ncbi:TcmI family type II polyketide cyclase [Nocardia sp. CNY236]|uniref:TcmI family type II polyketide cyclase n=1 Tax=Nocardia sp. CNY236 TaxID=1169152 RepID=UPI00048B438C|nr:TcmI family type II polyketide cyclase [Nocardia sp. CNY236]
MHSTLIVARMNPASSTSVAKIFEEFDKSEMPGLMGTVTRQLFHYRGLYFHLQEFESADRASSIEKMKSHPSFVRISSDLEPFISAYDPDTWRSPSDAMATRFYHWTQSS